MPPGPPYRELGKVEGVLGLARVTPLLERVVWQAAFLEELFEAVTARSSRVEVSFAEQEIARGMIGQGQRMTVLASPDSNSPLTTGASEIVQRHPY